MTYLTAPVTWISFLYMSLQKFESPCQFDPFEYPLEYVFHQEFVCKVKVTIKKNE